VVTLSNHSVALIHYNDSYQGVYNSSHVLHSVDIENEIVGLEGYQNKISNRLDDFVVLLERSPLDDQYYLRQYHIEHKKTYKGGALLEETFLKMRNKKSLGAIKPKRFKVNKRYIVLTMPESNQINIYYSSNMEMFK
jgi:hypothetical protein